ncbi:MAG: MFS transporter [Planctomycetota bacterium]|nr:MAG: MFS transporter [Planctomycetota bacterium]
MRNRWLIAAAAVAIHLSIGSVYAYSVLKNPLEATLGWSDLTVTGSFSLAIALLGVSAAVFGPFVERFGPRVSASVAGCCYGSGMLLAGLACHLNSVVLFYIGFGVLGGIGLGVGYISPVSTLVKYFPDRRGLATGLAIMGFGLGSLVYGPIMAYLLGSHHPAVMFWVLGAWYMVVMVGVAQYLKKPADLAPGTAQVYTVKRRPDLAQMGVREATGTLRFYLLWAMLFINVACGIAIISSASPLLENPKTFGLDKVQAAGIVGLMGLFNGIGRLLWASASDYLGRANTYLIFFGIQIIAFAWLPSISSLILFQIVLFTIMTCYGGGFATVPAFIGDLFGTKALGAIHGCILTAWSAAGICGPLLYSWLSMRTGDPKLVLQIFAGAFVLAFIITMILRFDIARIRRRQDSLASPQLGV